MRHRKTIDQHTLEATNRMNYLKLINQFWQVRRSRRVTNLQADVYYFLLQECNIRTWENPFQCPNGLICSSIGITEKSLIDARNALQQLGLIEVEKGVTKQKSPSYYLPEYWNKESNTVSIPVSNQGGIEGGNQGGIEVNIYNKQNKTKQRRVYNDAPIEKNDVSQIDANDDFLNFWNAFAKKIDKSKCEKKFKRLSKTERAKVLQHVPEYVKSTPDIQYRKNPLTYLTGKCWNDEGVSANKTEPPVESRRPYHYELHPEDNKW